MTRTSSSDDDSKGICSSPRGDGIISTGFGNRVTSAVRDPVKATSAGGDCGDGMKVTSTVGDGSKGPCTSEDGSSSGSPGGGAGRVPMRVLAVDDSNIDRKLVEMLLKTSSFSGIVGHKTSSSFNVTAVNSVMRALEVLGLDKVSSPERKKNTDVDFDLIITDYCMPEMTGYDLLKKVKDDSSPFKEVPVVIMSSENRPRRITRCMAEGAEEFIIKPVQLSDVQRLKCHVRQARETRMEQQANTSSSSTSKRKGSSGTSGLPTQNMERRARLTGLTVA